MRLDPPEVVVAYEPSWAIGQGMSAAPPEVTAEVHQGIHAWLRQRGFGPDRVRVIYGGSVDGTVAEALLRQPGVDGLFVGPSRARPPSFRGHRQDAPARQSSGHILSDAASSACCAAASASGCPAMTASMACRIALAPATAPMG